ncbi:hypothetical protein [Roseiconus lacunae]|uniref:hypothetical protein n=1 Tax=Roseiconus lacunae TaxID=2605694 RepID=UPI0011F260C3|nr:hypothetical protein [Roseiconus lacunae]
MNENTSQPDDCISRSSAGYAAIPVSVARAIGEDYRKDWVVILAYDHESQRTHATTWGRDPADKEGAVRVRDKCLETIGADMSDATTHQDYRFASEGERAKIVDDLVRACRAADHAIASVMAVRDGIPNEELQGVRDAIKAATDAA